MRVYYTHRGNLLFRGILSVTLGIILVALPQVTLTVIAILFAALLLINGATLLVEGVRTTGSGRAWIIGLGAIAALVGLGAVLWPDATITVLVVLLAVWAIIHGAYELTTSIRYRSELPGAFALGAMGALAIIFGIVLLFFPIAGARALAIVLGAYAIVSGVLLTIAGVRR